MKNIHVNQLGYRTNGIKKAIVPHDDITFEIIRDNVSVFNGKCGEKVFDAASNATVRIADFSEFRECGEFFIKTASGDSYKFTIGENPYAGFRDALLEMFNYQKCGVDLDCGKWSHPACHDSLATVYGTDEKLDVSGGWHDAGDYGRYIVPAAPAVADLLLAFELSPNPSPNLLETVWFEIEWMLKMQCKKTGGVYHKVSCRGFNALDEMPHLEKGELIICPISLTATADFAAITAMASRFYPTKKAELIEAAKRAWEWCEKNLDVPGFKNPPGITTGEYGDKDAKDELFWAACELFNATGNEIYHDYVKSSKIYLGLGWARMGTYGIAAYLMSGVATDYSLAEEMKERLRRECEDITENFIREPYGTSQNGVYGWGSNLGVANNAMTLLLYNCIVEERAYKSIAMEHMHYLLGRNPLSLSYITGFGTNAVKNPHHRPSVSVGEAFPGLVSGGPCAFATSDAAWKKHCEGKPPSMCFVDDKDSYSTNEITIYWNSPVYFVASVLDM